MQPIQENIPCRSSCAIAGALEILGDRWTLLIIRDALFRGITSFNEFRASPEGIASNILSARLEKLVTYGVLEKTRNPDNRKKIDYTLTERGRQLKPILMQLGAWGEAHIDGTMGVEKQMARMVKKDG